MSRITVDIDLNRVEGDLEFQVDLEDGVVVDARCVGTLYRGFEQIMIGRAPRDALVITPASAASAARPISMPRRWRWSRSPTSRRRPRRRVRNLCLMAETAERPAPELPVLHAGFLQRHLRCPSAGGGIA